jgi:transposase
MRFLGLDVHRDFCEVAIAEAGEVRLAGRVRTEPEALALFAQSLGGDDEVALEVTGNALGIARIIAPHVGRVVLANAKAVKGITRAGAKTDKIDARTLAKLLAGGFLPAVWLPDEQTRILRRRISARAQLVRQRTRAKNQVHATLIRNLKGKPPVSDLFGVRGRRWLAAQELPADEQETIAACLRQIEFLDEEITLLDKALAQQVLASAEMRRLLTLPGVNFVTAAALLAAIGEIRRFPTSRQLVSYLGLDPRVRQSGSEPARHGRISKQGPGETRHVLVEAAWHACGVPKLRSHLQITPISSLNPSFGTTRRASPSWSRWRAEQLLETARGFDFGPLIARAARRRRRAEPPSGRAPPSSPRRARMPLARTSETSR